MLSMTARPGRAPLQFWRQRRTAGPSAANWGGGEDRRRPDRGARRADRAARVRVTDRERPSGPRARPRSLPAAAAPRRRRLRRRLARARRAPRPRRRRQADRDARRRGAARGPSARRWRPRGSRTPGSSRLYESGRDDGAVYLVSELVRGRTLGELLDEGALSDRDVLRVGVALCDALAHAHGRGVVHRDVKPGNIIVPDAAARRRGRREAHRLRRRADRGRRRAHAHRRRRRHARLHGARAGRGPRRGRRGRPLRARARPLRGAGRRQPGARARRGRDRAARRRAPARARAPAPRPAARPLRRDRPRRPAAARAARHARGPARRARPRAARTSATRRGRSSGSPLEGDRPRPPCRALARRPRARVLAAVAAGALGDRRRRVARARAAAPAPRPPERPPRSLVAAAPAAGLDRRRRRARRRGSPPTSARARAVLVAAGGRARRRPAAPRAGRCGRRPAVAPVLGVVGLAGAWPALAGQAARPWHRLALGALGAGGSCSPRPSRTSGSRPGRRATWAPAQAVRRAAWTDVLVPIVTSGALLVAGAVGARGARAARAWCAAGSSRWTSSAPRSGPPRSAPRRRPWPPEMRGLVAGAVAAGGRRGAPRARHVARRTPVLPRSITPLPSERLAAPGRESTIPMSVLRNLEEKLAGLVEGTFGRVFRSQVRPVEIARKLAREMDEHKTVSVSRTYVPNEYAVWLSPEDRERFEGVEQEVIDELAAYLLEHARRERLALHRRPQIEFRTDERLSLGEFGIQARLVRAHARAGRRRAGRPRPDDGLLDRRPRVQEELHEARTARAGRAILDRRGQAHADRPGRRRHRAQPRVRRRAGGLQRLAPPRRDPARRAGTAGRSPTSARRTASRSTAARSARRRRSAPGDDIVVGTVDVRFEVER